MIIMGKPFPELYFLREVVFHQQEMVWADFSGSRACRIFTRAENRVKSRTGALTNIYADITLGLTGQSSFRVVPGHLQQAGAGFVNISKSVPESEIFVSSRTMSQKTTKKDQKQQPNQPMAFGRDNYILLLAGVVILIIGYLLMVGGGTDNLNEFNKDELFSDRRITVAPITLLVGFGVVLYGIMKKPRE